MISREDEYRAGYEWALAGKEARMSWLGEGHQMAYREGYAEGASHREFLARTQSKES